MISETAQPFDVGMFSADSHVIESPEVWKGILAPSFWPDNGQSFHVSSGGTDPERRAEEMAIDGVVAEVLYPSLGLKIFGVDDPGVQEAACRAYNQWLIDYCAADPTRPGSSAWA